MRRICIISPLFLFLVFCSFEKNKEKKEAKVNPPSKEQQIVDEAIEAHGGESYKNLRLEFDFRKRHYLARKEKDKFHYERIFEDSSGNKIRDILNNEGFVREINGKKTDISKEDAEKYTNSINAVFYFMLLPSGLNDGAVIKRYAGMDTIKNELYHRVAVSFQKEGGGEGFDDLYMYWFHQQKKTMDYFAYSYFEGKEKESRFRAATLSEKTGGILFQTYDNYEGLAPFDSLARLPKLFEAGKLKKFSEIKNENIKVESSEQ